MITDAGRVVAAGSDIAQLAVAIFAGVMCLRVGSWSSRHPWDRGWHLVGYGALVWAAGNCVWTYYEVVLGVANPHLSLADVGFLGMVPLVLLGLSRLIGLRRSSAIGVAEGLLIVCSLFYLSWATALGSAWAEVDEPLPWAVNLAYPVGDVAIASMALILLGSASGSSVRRSVALLAVGVLAITASDSAYIGILANYQTGHYIDLGWLLGFLLIGLAGRAARSAPRDEVAATGNRRSWVALPYVPLAVVAVTSVVLAGSSGPPSVMLAILLVVMVGLVVVRQALALNERDMLASDLSNTLAQVRRQQEILNQLAFSDPLTGLANRALFEQRIAVEPVRPGNTTAMFVDLNAFKAINDRHGHDVGDAVLVEVAQRLRACCRTDDLVARVGGDEFVVLARALPAAAVEGVAHRFLVAMRQPINVDGVEVSASASVGTASDDTGHIDVHELIRQADAAMYEAKTSGLGHRDAADLDRGHRAAH